MSDSWEFAEGDEIVPGRRTAVRRLGGGARYEAYLAWDEVLFAPVVVKIVRPKQVQDARALRALTREATVARELGHPSLVRAFDLVPDGPRPHVVLEFVEGPRLSTLLRKYGPLPLEQALPLGLELCSVLHYLAACEHVHLDLKPSNIVMAAPPRLIDLSIARTILAARDIDDPVGTDAYMAPEQALPRELGPPGPPADVWGLGATLYEALVGQSPFPLGTTDPKASAEQQWPQLRERPAAPPRSVPPQLADIVLACLAPEPAQRPTAAGVAGALEPLIAALPRPVLAGFLPSGRKRDRGADPHRRPAAQR